MKDTKTKAACAYFETHRQELKFIFTKIKTLNMLSRKVSAYLPPPLIPYCEVANLTANCLVLIVANGSIATQLRFQTADLLRRFKQDPALKHIHDIQCKVRPPHLIPRFQEFQQNQQKMQPLSAETATVLQDIAESLEDPTLKEVMKRIAAHRI